MRRFLLIRADDVSGVSGLGVVAEGVVFDDGTTVTHWCTRFAGTEIYRSVRHAQDCHGHEGKTKLVWVDEVSSRKASVPVSERYFGQELFVREGKVHRLEEYCFKNFVSDTVPE